MRWSLGRNAFWLWLKGGLIVYFHVRSCSLSNDAVKSRTRFPKNMYDFLQKHVRVFQKTSLTFALWKRRNDITNTASSFRNVLTIKYRRSPSTPASPARTETGRKDGAAVLIVITKHSVRNTAIRRKALPSN